METEIEKWEVIAKYLKGELSEQERHELSEWIQAHPKHQKIFDQAKALWFAAEPDIEFEIDVNKNWERFKNATMDARPDLNNERLTNKVVQKPMWPMLIRAAAVLVIGFLIAYMFLRPGQQVEMIVYSTSEKEVKEIFLPDHSRVYLNENSKLHYSPGFNLENRIVRLEGEAFFEIEKEEGYRFIVYAKNAKTEVLGTSFTVTAYDATPGVDVKVVTGRVAFSLHDESNTVFLEPGSKGTLSGTTGSVVKADIENENFLSWKTQKLNFNNTRFSKVIMSLEQHFGIKITVKSPDLLSCNYSGSFEMPEIEDVLEVLGATMNFKYDANNGTYEITGPGCK